MAIHWVQATRAIARHNLDGAYVLYHPGDWFQVRNQELARLIESGMVVTTMQIISHGLDLTDCGILIWDRDTYTLPKLSEEIKIRQSSKLDLCWSRTLLWSGKDHITAGAILLGMHRIEASDEYDASEMAVRLRDMRTLARDVGSKAERDKTLQAVGDLRLPVYDTGAVWVRRTPAVEDFLLAWQAELDQKADELHSFLRVLYSRRMLLCTLPPDFGERCGAYYM